ncbi:hypothetical protein L3X38_034101 [Prunus dulcis]|uniref:Uncharacterized protein n=1 Tax=Prunus dulcis TaxID=3755 RepID=A0AAD4YY91_PRUDU|nr:hypothetical protein L3X38_034101 [Prunus dulcis]
MLSITPGAYTLVALSKYPYDIGGEKVVVSPEQEHPKKAFGWATRYSSGVLSPFRFSRRATGENDVTFKVLYCGICHTDLHIVKNEWGLSTYPLIPGHEIVGVATEVGSKVEKLKVGDHVGVGYMIGACQSCDSCSNNAENYCPEMIPTSGAKYHDGTTTYGGYSDFMVANEHFVVHVPDNLPLHGAAPLLCAGVTTYSPLSRDDGQMKAALGTMDGIIDTVSAVHPLLPLIGLLKNNGKLVLVGAPEKPLELPVFPLLMGRKIVAGSVVGGMKETQEMIDFAGKHNITANVEVIPVDYVNTAMERLIKTDVTYRFVIDIANTLKSTS